MADPGQFTLNTDGQFFLNADGSWAVLNGAGECPACCGGGGQYPSLICSTRYPLQRSFICPLNNQLTTLNARNDWSDSFDWAGSVVVRQTVPPPCDNHVRFALGASAPGAATTNLHPLGTGKLLLNGSGYMLELWNGGGTVVESRLVVTAVASLGGFGAIYPPFTASAQVLMNWDSQFNPRLLGGITSANYQWQVPGQSPVPTAQGDVITLLARGEWVYENAAQVRLNTSCDGTITRGGATVAAWTQSTTQFNNWTAQQLPQCCGVQHTLGGTNDAFDDYSGAVINPVHVQP